MTRELRPIESDADSAESASLAALRARCAQLEAELAAARIQAQKQEQELGLALAAAQLIAYVLDEESGHAIFLGAELEPLYGADAPHLGREPARRHARVLEEDQPILRELQEGLRRQNRCTVEYRIRRDDGALRTLRERCLLERATPTAAARQFGIIADVTEWARLVEQLRAGEDEFRFLTRLAVDWYWEQDADLRFTKTISTERSPKILPQSYDYIGLYRWELPGSLLSEAEWATHRAQLARHESFHEFENRFCLADGERVWISLSGAPIFDAGGRFTGYRGVGRDISAQKRAELQLRKLSAAVEQSPVSIFITDVEGRIEYVNPYFCHSSGYAPEEVLGQNPRLFKSGRNPDALYRQLWQTITAGRRWSGELHNRRKNGELYWEHVYIYPLRSASGQLTHFIAVKEDITERKEFATREKLRQEQLLHHARLASMGEMAAALAHELNQPLAAISNFSGVLKHRLSEAELDRESLNEVVAAISSQALRAGEIVWRVRDFSRKPESSREWVDLNALIGDVVRLTDIAVRFRGIVHEFDLDENLPHVMIDRLQIEQVLFNLIRNAVEAMEKVAGEKWLRLKTRRNATSQQVQVSVSDRGCGLPDRIAADLFTPFYTTKPQGMGMGLSISRGIVEAHGGRLWAAPDPQTGGTTFHFTLPLPPRNPQ